MLVDAHSHADCYPRSQIDEVLDDIERSRIFTIGVSTTAADYMRLRDFAARSRYVVPNFGIHPWYAPDFVHNLQALDPFLDESPMYTEIGLDYLFVPDSNQWPAQRELLGYFFDAARRQDKIVNLHTPGANEDLLEMLDDYEIRRAIIHWFVGSEDLLNEFTSRGYYITVGYAVTALADVQEVARIAPAEYLLTETDNPYAQQEFTRELGMPSVVKTIVDEIASQRGQSAEAVERQVQSNLLRRFENDPRLDEAIEVLSAG